ncbi:MAG: type II toxin-antitoxin system VapC family toxin [Proteobacteria bacterium]|nr:type II toxin-antitoxin system VapC family toxin [Pseudomonadota bacterium]
MKYLLDTCCIIDFVKGDANTAQHLKHTAPSDIAISSITVMELEYGLLYDPQRTKKLKPIIQAIISNVTVLPYTETDAKMSALLRAQMRKSGTPIGSYDALIAGTALNHKLILVTSNEKEFRRMSELSIENWRG